MARTALQKAVRLELNNSGSWKILGRFDAADDEQAALVLDAAEDLIKTLHNNEDPPRLPHVARVDRRRASRGVDALEP